MRVRKYVNIVEEIRMENGRDVDPPAKKAAAVAVVENPLAGDFVEDLTPLMQIGEKLGSILTKNALVGLGIEAEAAESFGKAVIIGLKGELEHGAAILHPKLGKPVRDVLGAGKAIMPSAKKVGVAGSEIDVPLHFKDAAFVRSHFDAMSVRVPDAPRENEILVAIVITNSGRPLPRVGGLRKEEVKMGDGLR